MVLRYAFCKGPEQQTRPLNPALQAISLLEASEQQQVSPDAGSVAEIKLSDLQVSTGIVLDVIFGGHFLC